MVLDFIDIAPVEKKPPRARNSTARPGPEDVRSTTFTGGAQVRSLFGFVGLARNDRWGGACPHAPRGMNLNTSSRRPPHGWRVCGQRAPGYRRSSQA